MQGTTNNDTVLKRWQASARQMVASSRKAGGNVLLQRPMARHQELCWLPRSQFTTPNIRIMLCNPKSTPYELTMTTLAGQRVRLAEGLKTCPLILSCPPYAFFDLKISR